MSSNLIGRSAALLTVVFFLASFTTASGQRETTLTKAKRTELLNTVEAVNYRNHLVDKLGGKLNITDGASNAISVTGDGKTVICEIVSQFVTLRSGNVEQISIRITENNVVQEVNLVQYANGDLGTLEGDKLVTYTLSNTSAACVAALAGNGPSCTACRNKLNTCFSNNRVVKIIGCLLRNFDGSCLSCGYQLDAIVACVLNR